MGVFDQKNYRILKAQTPVAISSDSPLSVGVQLAAAAAGAPASTAVTANRAYFVPFTMPAFGTIRALGVANGSTVSGDASVGIYDEDFNRLIVSTNTQTPTNSVQFTNIVLSVRPGRYYLALSFDNGTAQVRMYLPAGDGLANSWDCLHQESAFPLPSTATPTQDISAHIPLLTARMR